MSAPPPREIELKLELDPADLARIRQRLRRLAGGAGRTEDLVSVYFDTPDQALRAESLTLRVRSTGDRHVQTVKAGRGKVGLFARSEWETDLAGPEPDLKAARRTPAGPVLRKGRAAVAPMFETAVTRTAWLVETDRAAIEVALDRGEVAANGASRPLAELELELKRGAPADLFALLRQLEGTVRLRIGAQAKSDQGFALLDGEAPKAFKAEPVALSPGMSTAAAFQAILHACIRQFRLNEPLVVETRAPESLHQARVGMRRLRSALSLFKPVIEDAQLPALKARLQAVSRELGEARNLDVYLERSARPEAERDPAEPGAAAFLGDMEARRGKAYDAIARTLASKAFRRLMLDLVEWLETGPWLTLDDPLRRDRREQPIETFAAAVLERRRRKLKRKGRHLDRLDPHARHRVRVDAKKLRYASEFFAALATRGRDRHHHAAFTEAMETLQGHLGDLNDIQTGHEIALAFAARGKGGAPPAAFAAAHVSGEQDARVPHLLEAASAAHQETVEAKRFWARWSRG